MLQFSNPTATSEDLTSASSSQLGVVFKAESKEVVLRWVDTFASETAYRVERQTDGSTWQLQESLAASANTGVPYAWQRVIDASATYRVVAQRDGYVVPLQTSAGQSSVAVDPAATPPELVIDQQEPVRGAVQVSVNGASTAQSVQYFADLGSIGTSNTGPSFGVSWDSRQVADGNHQLQANVSYGSGLSVELQRSIAVDNPNVAVVFYYLLGVDQIELTADASSDAGVASVEFQVNGNSIVVLNAPNQGTRWTHPSIREDCRPGPRPSRQSRRITTATRPSRRGR